MAQTRRELRQATRSIERSVRVAAQSRRRATQKRVLQQFMSLGAMVGVGALLVSTSLPANAFQPETAEEIAAVAAVDTQSMVVHTAAASDVARDTYTVALKPKPKPKPVVRMSAMVGSYTNNPNGSIQWPFPNTAVTSGFGPRGGGFHAGADFFPGEGTPIGAIADGVVTHAGGGAGGWGQYVVVSHNINGQNVTSLYAHMQYGSIGVAVGQHVGVGTYLGAVGATGRAYGAHLHLEIKVNGTLVDPYAWLRANAG